MNIPEEIVAGLLVLALSGLVAYGAWINKQLNALNGKLYKKLDEMENKTDTLIAGITLRINDIEKADALCRSQRDNATNKELTAIEMTQLNHTNVIETMSKKSENYTKKLNDMETQINGIKKDVATIQIDLGKIETEMKEHNKIMNKVADMIELMHGEVKSKKDVLKKAVGHSKKSINISKENYKG